MSKKVVLSGYFGYDNLGDEAILYSMVQELKKMDQVEILVLSANPPKTMEKFGVKAVDRMNLLAVAKALRSADLFVSGGGSLFQDVTSKRSIFYYLGQLFLAKTLFRKKVMIYSQGVGPIQNAANGKKLAKAFNKLDCINVRDQESKELLQNLGVKKPISVTADTVFLLDSPNKEEGEKLLQSMGVDGNKTNIGISIRPWKEWDEKIVEEISVLVDYYEQEDVNIILLPFHHPGDLELSKKVMEQTHYANVYLVEKHLNEREMLSVIGNMDIVLSMRLHGLIFAIVGGAYPIGISYDPKIQSLLKEMNLPLGIEVEQIRGEALIERMQNALMEGESNQSKVHELQMKMKNKSMENMKLLKELII